MERQNGSVVLINTPLSGNYLMIPITPGRPNLRTCAPLLYAIKATVCTRRITDHSHRLVAGTCRTVYIGSVAFDFLKHFTSETKCHPSDTWDIGNK